MAAVSHAASSVHARTASSRERRGLIMIHQSTSRVLGYAKKPV
jgi:hypothetical protein